MRSLLYDSSDSDEIESLVFKHNNSERLACKNTSLFNLDESDEEYTDNSYCSCQLVNAFDCDISLFSKLKANSDTLRSFLRAFISE